MLSLAAVFAQESHDLEIEEGRELLNSGIGCDKLTDEQLESLGEYYMEQMHPGEAHEIMDEMMGGEGSERLKQVHVQIAKRLYCNESGIGGMMNMMMGNNMMGSGIMIKYPGNYNYASSWNLLWLFFLIGVIALIIWLIYKFTKKSGVRLMEKNTEKDKNAWLWVLVVAVVLLFLFGGLGMGGYGLMPMMGWGLGVGFMFFPMLLFWGLLIWLVVALINPAQPTRKEDSLGIIKRRYASGEITKKQYEDMKKELNR